QPHPEEAARLSVCRAVKQSGASLASFRTQPTTVACDLSHAFLPLVCGSYRPLRNAAQLLKDELANSYSARMESQRIIPEITHLQHNHAGKTGMDGWRSQVYHQTKPCKGASALHASSDLGSSRKVNVLSGEAEHE